ncbi:MAG: CocE/NonD family hydrolase [Thermomicrobiales bacterium]|nr:CocE/NonD family hydrolase [Thermomicrobiales bacterium]
MAREHARPLPGLPGVTLERDVPCRMRDGVTLFADVYRPEGEGPFPVILMRLPYDKTSAENITYADPSWYARHGYLVVIQDNCGRCASEGEFVPFLREAEDGYDTIEWAARLPGANGRVGMYGFSYAGATQLLPATLRPPSLVTICPAMTASQYYEGWTYNQGALALAFTMSWATQLASGDARRAKDAAALSQLDMAFAGVQGWHWFLPLRDYPPLSGAYGGYFADWLGHPTYDDYWRRWSIDADYSRLDTPALHIAGWYDVFLSGSVQNFLGLRAGAGSEEARRSQKLVIGPWLHMPWAPVSADSSGVEPTVVDDLQLRWFDQFLKGEESGVMDAPVSLFVMGAEEWRDYPDWPPPGAEPVNWYLHSAGRANSRFGDGTLSLEAPGDEPPDIYTYDPAYPNQSAGGHSCCFSFISPMGPVDQRVVQELNSILVYTSEPLAAPMELIGDVSVTLFAATSAVDTDWAARLCEVWPDGRSINLQEGIVRARYRDSLTDPSLLEPDRVYEYEIPLGPVGARIAAGNRLRLTIASSDFPQWDRNLNTGGPLFSEVLTDAVVARQTVLHDALHPSHVTLPVVTAESR